MYLSTSKAVWNGMKFITGCGVIRGGLLEEGVNPTVELFLSQF